MTAPHILFSRYNFRMEAKLKFVKKTAYEFSMKVIIKLEDITEEQREALFKLELIGEPIDIQFRHFQKEEPFSDEKDSKSQMLQKLGWLMTLYCQQKNLAISDEIRKVYEKYNIVSRRDLTEEQLEKIIDQYKTWLKNPEVY